MSNTAKRGRGRSRAVHYFLGNIPEHGNHAIPLYKKIGGTFIVLSQNAYLYCKERQLDVVMINDRPDLFLEFSSGEIPETVEYINENASVVVFYEVFGISEDITVPQIMLTHGNSFKNYYIEWRQKVLPFYTYIAALGPDWGRRTLEAGAKPQQLLKVGLARADDIIKKAGKTHGRRHIAKKLGLDPSKKIITYMPTWWGPTSAIDIGYKIVMNMPEEYSLIFRPHPNTPKDVIDKYRRLIECEKLNACYVPDSHPSGVDLLSIYNATSLFIGDMSSVMLDAILTDKPVLFAFGEDINNKQDLRVFDLIQPVLNNFEQINDENISRLADVIEISLEKGIDKKAYQVSKERVFYGLDGRNVESIASVVNRLAK